MVGFLDLPFEIGTIFHDMSLVFESPISPYVRNWKAKAEKLSSYQKLGLGVGLLRINRVIREEAETVF